MIEQYITSEEPPMRRVHLVGPYTEGSAVLNEINRVNGTVERSGPYTDKKMFPRHDGTRFLIIARIPTEAQ